MTNRELLELAAKAAGLDGRIRAFVTGLMYDLIVDENNKEWNPLTDDGDALRLAVKLALPVVQFKSLGYVAVEWDGGGVMEYLTDDPNAATRRAITRAAAEIGRTMK